MLQRSPSLFFVFVFLRVNAPAHSALVADRHHQLGVKVLHLRDGDSLVPHRVGGARLQRKQKQKHEQKKREKKVAGKSHESLAVEKRGAQPLHCRAIWAR